MLSSAQHVLCIVADSQHVFSQALYASKLRTGSCLAQKVTRHCLPVQLMALIVPWNDWHFTPANYRVQHDWP